jgi:predicted DNA-binding protein
MAMDDKELIKRIMEEVKDEKLREELLRRVAKGEGGRVWRKFSERIEHRLKARG